MLHADVLRRPAASSSLAGEISHEVLRHRPRYVGSGGGNAKTANRRLRNVLKAQSVAPRVIFTDKLVGYAAAREAAM